MDINHKINKYKEKSVTEENMGSVFDWEEDSSIVSDCKVLALILNEYNDSFIEGIFNHIEKYKKITIKQYNALVSCYKNFFNKFCIINRKYTEKCLKKEDGKSLSGYTFHVLADCVEFANAKNMQYEYFFYKDPKFQKKVQNFIMKLKQDKEKHLKPSHEQNDKPLV